MSFNSAVYLEKKLVDTTMFWDCDNDKFIMPEVSNGQPQLHSERSMPRDKHWSPYTYNNQLYMLYSIDPLRIMFCDRKAKCRFVQNNADNKYKFDDLRDSLRGGTPTINYAKNYYITIAHSTQFKKGTYYKRYYGINLVVLRINSESDHQIVYLSAPIQFHKKLMNSIPLVRYKFIDDPFVFPVSLVNESLDSLVIGGHINDHSSYLLRLTGIKSLMNKVMSQQISMKGPVNMLLQNLTRQFASQVSGYEFMT